MPMSGIDAAGIGRIAAAAEAAGFTDLWSGEEAGNDAFTPLALAAAATERIRLGTGIVSVFTRGPAVLAQHAAALQEASNGRFVLGLGTSAAGIVRGWNGIEFTRPVGRARDAVRFVREALDGGRPSARDGDSGTFRLANPPKARVPVYLAGLRERMLTTAGAIADGVWINLAPLDAVPRVLDHVAAGARSAGRDPDALDVVSRFCWFPGPRETALNAARRVLAGYLSAPVYADYFRWLGYGDALAPAFQAWRDNDRHRALDLLPADLIDQVFLVGSSADVAGRIAAYRAAGVRTPVLTPVANDGRMSSAPDVTDYTALIEAAGPPPQA